MEGILDANVLGEHNSCTLDCGVFTDRSEWRKSAGVAENKLNVRI